MLRGTMDRIVVSDVEHTESFMRELTQAVFIDKLVHFPGRIQNEGERVTSDLELDVVIIEGIDPRKFLMRCLDTVDIILVGDDLKFIKRTQLFRSISFGGLHAVDGCVIE